MPALIKPGSVKVITQDGEVHVLITLELNINLNSDGLTSLDVNTETQKATEKKIDDTAWAIPDFESSSIEFGKKD